MRIVHYMTLSVVECPSKQEGVSKMEKIMLQVEGMTCAHCEKAVKTALLELGAKAVKAWAKKKTVEVTFSPDAVTQEEIKNEIKEMGYRV